ncbi:MAG: CAP domain-containing protein [Deltaproteobacteria bacterium]|nr:CAP domain-containing protein [Deltaproteobacteria bacterium]
MTDNIVDTAFAWVNQARMSEGLEALSMDPKLNRVAESLSQKMAELNILSDNDPALGAPFERMQSSGLTDINNIVAVAKAKTPDLLRRQVESAPNLLKILSPEMTHAGIGIKQDLNGHIWLTVHMTERAIALSQFTLSQSNTIPVTHSITVKGKSPYKKIEAVLVPPENTHQGLEKDHIIVPDSNGDFEVTLDFGTATGRFEVEFYVEKDGVFRLKNFFSIVI